MAEIKIRLIYNLNTGKKDIYVEYEADDDALPIEHEKEHRDIVEKLVGQNVLSSDEVGDVVVERLRPGVKAPAAGEAEPLAEGQAEPG